jgi:hypothetical protein
VNGAIDPSNAPGSPWAALTVEFPTPVNRVGFELNADDFNALTGPDIDLTVSTSIKGGPLVGDIVLTSTEGRFRFHAFESTDTFDVLQINVGNGALWRLDNLRYELNEVIVPMYNCVGFDPPADRSRIGIRKNRVVPLKAQLLGEDGLPLSDADVAAPPQVQVEFSSGATNAIDVSSDSLSAGQGTDGNKFEFPDGRWRYNLKTSNYTMPGTYIVSLISGDPSEYVVDPTCEVEFVVE